MTRLRNDQPISWVCPVNWLAPLNRGLAGWWLAASGVTGGSRWNDLVNQKNGTLTNSASWDTNRLYVNGATQHVTSGVQVLDWSATRWCVQVVAEHTTRPDQDDYWVSYGSGFTTNGQWAFGRRITFGSTRDLTLRIRAFGGTSSSRFSDAMPAVGTHAYTFQPDQLPTSSMNSTCWVNGTKYTGTNANTLASLSESFNPAGHPVGSSNPAIKIHSVRVWNRALSDGEMAAINREAMAGWPTTLNRINRVFAYEAAAPGGAAYNPFTGGINPLQGYIAA